MPERHLVLLQVPILDRPDRSAIFCEPDDGRFRNQQRLRKRYRCDIDLCLFAQINTLRYLFERNLDFTLLIHAVAFRLDTRDVARNSLAGLRSQHDFGRLADLDLAGLALVDIGKHPDRFRID